MTTLLSMTVSASAIIAAIIVIRSLFIHRLPKRLFVILWAIAALRMLVPFSFSVNIPHENTQPENVVVREFAPSEPPELTSGTSGAPNRDLIFGIVWAGGVVISLGIMTALHLSSRRELFEALPTDDTEIQSHISADLTCLRSLFLPPLRAFIGSILWLGQCSRLQIRILSFPAMKRC